MQNQLATANSPYLLQHKDNPVHWHEWGKRALQKAQDENKPIFLSIGYAACHWCHVMEHESFEDTDTANLMNQHFINIKVDREERPDIDSIYMEAVVSLTGQGGWPMSMFLTPAGEPFYGGTYFPPVQRYGMPSFKEVLIGIAQAWENDNENVLNAGKQLASRLNTSLSLINDTAIALDNNAITNAVNNLTKQYDWEHGGWGQAPKFPQPMSLIFLLQRASSGDKTALKTATHALKEMAKGGMYDVVGGGFSRYSVDNHWLVPHFEKMLYDNALLARAYLHAFLITGDLFFKQICEETLSFIMREMTGEQGGFYSSLDADSEGVEGKFYVWSMLEIEQILTDQVDLEFFKSAYDISQGGNFEGANILQRATNNETLANEYQIDAEGISEKLRPMHKKLLAARSQRIRPGTDDKVLVSWNAWMLQTFAEAARYLQREDFLAVAQKNAAFLVQELHNGERLLRSWRKGQASHNAYLEDYASLILSLLSLYQSDGDPSWYQHAERLTNEMLENYADEAGTLYDTRHDHETLITRPQDLQDNATPSGSSIAAMALLQMHTYSGNGDWYDRATQLLGQMQEIASAHPTAFANWLSALDFAMTETKEIAIIGKQDAPEMRSLIEAVWSRYRPDCKIGRAHV